MSFARSSRDLLRLVGGLILLLVGLALATIFSDALLGFEIDSPPGGGTQFALRFPYVHVPARPNGVHGTLG